MSKLADKNIDDGLILSGYQKKLTTMKKKFFVLYKETARDCARLEYFDSIKKFKSGTAPKRVVKLENCFNINRRLDTKYDHVIALATKDGGFGIVLDSETEMLKWLQTLLSLQRSTNNKSEISSKIEHVWQVVVQKKNLAEERKIIGNYHVCLSPKAVTFIRIGPEKSSSGYIRTTDIQIPLNTIRRCGDSHCLFYMEVGRQCTIGPGELWMETEDPLVAQSMHKMISSAMSARTDVNGDMMRRRSSSVTETSIPINFIDTGNIPPEMKKCSIIQSANNNLGRGRCDSFPSNSRESTDYLKQSFKSSNVLNISNYSTSHRPISLPRHNTSPPSVPHCTARNEPIKLEDQEETGNCLPFRFKSAEIVIPEENSEDLINSDGIGTQNEPYISMAPVVKQDNPIDLGDAAILSSVNLKKCMVTQNLSPQIHSINSIYSALSTDLEKEERPKRSYSTGSKIDKNKIKRFANSNEIVHDSNAVRVRAFSVGSRAKIPKCDLQRAVLFPKSRLNQSCISNNSLNFGTDEAGYKSDLNSSCDKKSTSAPILVQNCPVSMDYMSDLMEIDFSKSASHKAHGKESLEKHLDSCLHEFRSPLTSKYECDFSECLSVKSKDCGESGYLEMKPIDCVIDKQTASIYTECLVKMPKLNENASVVCVKGKEIKNTAQGKNVLTRKILNKQNDSLCLAHSKEKPALNEVSFNQIKERLKESDYSTCSNIDCLSSIYSNLSIQPISFNHTEEGEHFPVLDVKLPKKSESYNQEYNIKIISENLQNKNEYLKEIGSSEQKSTGKTEKYLNLASSSSMSSGQLSSRCKSSSMTRFNDGQTLINTEGNRENENLLGNFPIDKKPQTTNVSISSTDCSNYELYYAKLDLPQSCSKDNVKFHKTENDLSTIVNIENDSYAKIDFEHSSDSSSSSKTINN